MFCHHPVEQGGIGYRRRVASDADGQVMLGSHKFNVGQEFESTEQFLYIGAQCLRKRAQDVDDFPPFFCLQLTDAVVGLHHVGRLYEYGFSAGTLVMHNASQTFLQGRHYGYHQTAVAQGGRHVLFHESLGLCLAQDRLQGVAHRPFGLPQLAADVGQLWAGLILDAPIFVQNLLHAFGHAQEGEYPLGKLLQSWVLHVVLLVISADERHPCV